MNGGGFGNIEGRDDKNVVIDVNPGIIIEERKGVGAYNSKP